jgi:hypothetical protein
VADTLDQDVCVQDDWNRLVAEIAGYVRTLDAIEDQAATLLGQMVDARDRAAKNPLSTPGSLASVERSIALTAGLLKQVKAARDAEKAGG